MSAVYLILTIALIVAAIYGTLVYLMWRQIRAPKKPKTTHQPEIHQVFQIER